MLLKRRVVEKNSNTLESYSDIVLETIGMHCSGGIHNILEKLPQNP